MDIDFISGIFFAAIRSGTPLLLVALGEMVLEKSGVLNLGQEGMMLMGAVVGFMVTYQSDSLFLGFLIATFAGMVMATLFGLLSLNLNTNQIATGLALTIFGTGLSAFLGANYEGQAIFGLTPWEIPMISSIPLVGEALFSQDAVVYLSWIIFIGVYFLFKRTKLGLTIRAVGENPDAANAIGLSVYKIRFGALLFGGAMAGLAGSYLSLAYTPLWTENMTAGRGWIALALVVFASWRAKNILLGAYLFGFASIIHLVAQGAGMSISANLLAMLPYVATIIVLMLLSKQGQLKQFEPMALAKPWRKNH